MRSADRVSAAVVTIIVELGVADLRSVAGGLSLLPGRKPAEPGLRDMMRFAVDQVRSDVAYARGGELDQKRALEADRNGHSAEYYKNSPYMTLKDIRAANSGGTVPGRGDIPAGWR
jgi:hypothetical protein